MALWMETTLVWGPILGHLVCIYGNARWQRVLREYESDVDKMRDLAIAKHQSLDRVFSLALPAAFKRDADALTELKAESDAIK